MKKDKHGCKSEDSRNTAANAPVSRDEILKLFETLEELDSKMKKQLLEKLEQIANVSLSQLSH